MSEFSSSRSGQVESAQCSPGSRRSFLRRSAALGAAVPSVVLALAGQSHAGKGKGPVLTPLPNLFTNENKNIFFEILQDEENHVTQLSILSDFVSGTNPARPTFKNLVASTPQQFVQMAAVIENGGVGSYLQGLNAISPGGHADYFLTAAGITAVEAQHTGFLNALLNQPIAPSALANENQPGIATPIPPQAIITAISGLGVIDSLNDFAPFFTPYNTGFDFPVMNTGNTDDLNDQHIINFSLVLEFLEVEFYRQNIEQFFSLL